MKGPFIFAMLKLLDKLRKSYSVLRFVPLDADSFLKNYRHCDLKKCQAMCCYKGCYVGPMEAAEIRKLFKKHKDFFARHLGITEDPLLEKPDPQVGIKITTKTKPYTYPPQTQMPENFKPTACIFLDEEKRCGLQVLSVELGKHPWYYKPSGCWLHPIQFVRAGKPEICLMSKEEYDPILRPDAVYAPFTHCGTSCGAGVGRAGVEIFKEELNLFGQMLGRDLIGEIEAAEG